METKPETKLEQLGPLAWRLTLGLDVAAIEAAAERRLAELGPRAEVRGFRRGKAPMTAVWRAYGARLREQQWRRAAQREIRRVLAEHGLRPIAAPKLERLAEGAVVSASFEVFPELAELGLEQIEVYRPVVTISESDVDYMLARLGGPKPGADLATRREQLRRTMETELPEAVETELAFLVEEALLAAHPDLELPPGVVEEQIARLRQLPGTARRTPESIEHEARCLLTIALVLAEAARQLGVRSDPAELWQETEKMAAKARHPQEELDRIWADDELIHEHEDLLLRRRVIAAVLERVKVIDEPMSFEELARRRRERAG